MPVKYWVEYELNYQEREEFDSLEAALAFAGSIFLRENVMVFTYAVCMVEELLPPIA